MQAFFVFELKLSKNILLPLWFFKMVPQRTRQEPLVLSKDFYIFASRWVGGNFFMLSNFFHVDNIKIFRYLNLL